MGVYIKDLEMPETCKDCIFFDWDNKLCIENTPFMGCSCKLLAWINKDKMGKYRTKWWVGTGRHTSSGDAVVAKYLIYPDEKWEGCPLEYAESEES